MKTYIWANDHKEDFYFFVAVSNDIESARNIVIEKMRTNTSYNRGVSRADDVSNDIEEWVKYVNEESPVIIEGNSGGIFFHGNE
jgi:hypothetical protein